MELDYDGIWKEVTEITVMLNNILFNMSVGDL
jgi:hypothetical protein